MNIFYVTGTSSGIGLALINEILKNEDNWVVGYSRRFPLSHERYQHITVDLAAHGAASKVEIPVFDKSAKVVLINNAGMLGDVKPVGMIDNNLLEQTFILNSIAPAILTNRILALYDSQTLPIIIINISSGAGRHPIESWAGYCASKAALDMFTLVAANDLQISRPNVHLISVAPGIVDTPMQDSIREVDSSNFPLGERFKNYKEQGMLSNPHSVAQKILELVANPASPTIVDLRDI